MGQDSTVALVEDGKLRSAVSEERFSRIKHDGGYTSIAIQYCLNEAGITFSDVDKIAVGFGLPEEYITQNSKLRFSSEKTLMNFNTCIIYSCIT